MKETVDRPRRPSVFLLLAVLAVLAVGGHLAGRQAARAGLFHATDGSGHVSAAGDSSAGLPARARPAAVDRKRLESTLARMKAILRDCPDLAFDWEAQAQLSELLGGLDSAEMAEIFRTLDYSRDREVMMKIGAFWAGRDPGAALQAALDATPGSDRLATDIFGDWARGQPAEALAWLGSATVPERLEEQKAGLYQQILLGTNLLERDFSLATSTLGTMKPAYATTFLNYWGSQYSGNAEVRDQLIAYAKSSGRPTDYAALNAGLVRSWPQGDSVAMMNHLIGLRTDLENQKAAPEVQRQVDASAVGVAIFREYDGPALDWWMQRHATDTEVPPALADSLSYWMNRYPDKATAWFADQQPTPQLDAMRATWANTLLRSNRYDDAAAQITQISDAQARQDAAAKLSYLWSAADPEKAAAWKAGVDQSNNSSSAPAPATGK